MFFLRTIKKNEQFIRKNTRNTKSFITFATEKNESGDTNNYLPAHLFILVVYINHLKLI
jgi:hypothetical protein